MAEHLSKITQRGQSSGCSSVDLKDDVDNLEVLAINVLYDIENARRCLALEQGPTTERANLLADAAAFAKRARKILKASRASPTELALAEARTWLDQARKIVAKAPSSCLDACLVR